MPRTKANRAVATKRARDNVSEIDDILRDFDIEHEQALQQIRSIHKQVLEDADAELEMFRSSIPPRVLKIIMGELKTLASYNDIDAAISQTMNDMNMTVKDCVQKADEGYITGEASNKSQLTSDSESNYGGEGRKLSTISSLKSFKARRRSQSVSNLPTHTTPGPRAMMKMKTPNVKSSAKEQYYPSSNTHASRSKYRTPLVNKNIQRAVSAEPFAPITPKVNPTAPVAILRHAKPGEVAYSLTGSPVVASNTATDLVNMNIPYKNGVLMIRPENVDPSVFDSTVIHNALGENMEKLLTLQKNLNIIMNNFEKRNQAKQ